MSYKKVEVLEWFGFENENDVVEGIVVKKSSRLGLFGEQEYLVLLELKTEKEIKVPVTAGLVNIDWDEYLGKTVKIQYLGTKKNERTRRTFKAFDVYIDE